MNFEPYKETDFDIVGVLVKDLYNFNPIQIARSGQCFSCKELTNKWVLFRHKDKQCVVRKMDKHTFAFRCSVEDFIYVWWDYFDLNTDYSKFGRIIKREKDEYLMNAYRFGSGIRILRQDTWEMIFSFIVSQQKQIPSIIKTLDDIRKTYGWNKESEAYEFPDAYTLSILTESDYRQDFRLGYRSPFLFDAVDAVLDGSLDIDTLKQLSYDESFLKLKELNGVGDKVADCICLFGLHHLEAFPIDTWIKQIIENHYNGEFDYSENSPYYRFQGYVQQLMYYYERNGVKNGK